MKQRNKGKFENDYNLYSGKIQTFCNSQIHHINAKICSFCLQLIALIAKLITAIPPCKSANKYMLLRNLQSQNK